MAKIYEWDYEIEDDDLESFDWNINPDLDDDPDAEFDYPSKKSYGNDKKKTSSEKSKPGSQKLTDKKSASKEQKDNKAGKKSSSSEEKDTDRDFSDYGRGSKVTVDEKEEKPVYKKVWFWCVIAGSIVFLVLIIVLIAFGMKKSDEDSDYLEEDSEVLTEAAGEENEEDYSEGDLLEDVDETVTDDTESSDMSDEEALEATEAVAGSESTQAVAKESDPQKKNSTDSGEEKPKNGGSSEKSAEPTPAGKSSSGNSNTNTNPSASEGATRDISELQESTQSADEEEKDVSSSIEIVNTYIKQDVDWGDAVYFVVLKNNGNLNANVTLTTTAYSASGEEVGEVEGYIDVIGPGTTSIVEQSFSLTEVIDHFDNKIVAMSDLMYESGIKDVSVEQTNVSGGVEFRVTNNGSAPVESVILTALFFNGSDLVYHMWDSFTNAENLINPGETISEEMTCDESFDRVEYYISGCYREKTQ
ncbi:MAG: hypothetical protein K5931_00960 [Lachnospiraceae bacterium]|nr:hypothetical protein [Lachnospiraceae bacterium]